MISQAKEFWKNASSPKKLAVVAVAGLVAYTAYKAYKKYSKQ